MQFKYLKKNLIGLVFVFLIVLTLIGCGGGGGSSTPPPTTGSISGTITFDVTEPLSKLPSINAPFVNNVSNNSFRSAIVPNEKIITFKDNLTLNEINNIVQGMGGKLKHKIYGTKNTYVVTSDTIRAFKANDNNNPGVVSIEDNLKFYKCTTTPNDQGYNPDQVWNYSMLFLPEAWDIEKGKNTVTVAVVDTGISRNHPDLINNIVNGWDFVDYKSTDPENYPGDNDPSDTTYYDEDNRWSHGTHVAGIISACTDNSIGVAGVCWNVKIMPIRVLGPDGSGSLDKVTAGINWAVAHGAKVINLSLGGPSFSNTLHNAIIDAVNAGVTVVAAAGNDGGAVSYPAKYDEVIAVSALGPNGTIASYSNFGPEVFVCAPGGDYNGTLVGSTILSTSYDKKGPNPKYDQNWYCYMQGTSMACPHISGLVALMYSSGKATTPAGVKNLLQQYAIDKGGYGKDNYYGYGIPDIYAILKGHASYKKEAQILVVDTNKNIEFVQNPLSNGNYSITNIQPGVKYVCAFLDYNMNGKVDNGDKFAFISGVSVSIGQNTSVNTMTLTTVGGLSTPLILQNYIQTNGVLY